ncbi:lipase family protein, partial [Methylobacterium platani]
MTTLTYTAQDAAALAPLAEMAGGRLPTYVPSWNLVGTIGPVISSGCGQGFTVMGTLPSTGAQVAVLALGSTWDNLTGFYGPEQLPLEVVPREILPEPSPPAVAAKAQTGFLSMIAALEAALTTAVKQLAALDPFQTSLPLVVVGIGTGAPLAQLAALYVRPGNTLAQGYASPVTEIACYAFSCPPIGDANFRQQAGQRVASLFTVNAAGIDFFPAVPAGSGLMPAGTAVPVNAKLPTYDSPWQERTAAFYAAALGEAQAPAATRAPARAPATAATGAARYDANLAYSLAITCAVAYQRFQHPTLFTYPPSLGLSVGPDIQTADGVTWGTVFSGPGTVAVAFRGTTSFVELVRTLADVNMTAPPWLTNGTVLSGIATVYQSLRPALLAQLQAVCIKNPGAVLYVAGHDAGAALASLAALDLTTAPASGIPVPTGLYGFGCPPFGDYTFLQHFGTTLAPSFQIVRPSDVVPKLMLNGNVFALPTAQSLAGGALDPANGNSYHAVATYIGLLNPFGTARIAAASLTAQAEEMDVSGELIRGLAPEQASHFEAALKARNIRPGQVPMGTLDSAATPDGVLRIGWSPRGTRASSIAPVGFDGRKMDGYFAYQEVRVRSGHSLIVQAEEGHRAHLVTARLTLEPGSRVEVNGEFTLSAAELAAPTAGLPGATLRFVGTDGGPGSAGMPGSPGMDGAPGRSGTSGSSGGFGSSGMNGTPGFAATVTLGTVTGTVTVFARGGNGGPGGAGGKGG